MAKKSMIAREHKREKASARFQKVRNKLRQLMKSVEVEFDDKLDAQTKLQKQSRNGSPVRHVRRCRECGRPKAVYRKFGLCRIHLREAAMRGDVPGLVKASW